MIIKINNVGIEFTNARVDIDDLNDGEEVFNPGQVQVNVTLASHVLTYQTSSTLDAGGVSSQLSINVESGAYDNLLSLLKFHNAIDDTSDVEEQVYAAGALIGDAINVQSKYDTYLRGFGSWDTANGMDANSEVFSVS